MPNYLLIIGGGGVHVDLPFGLLVLGKRLDLIFLWIDAKELLRSVNDVLRKGRPASRVVDECLLQPKRTKAKDTE
jgi:hypothetical protein